MYNNAGGGTAAENSQKKRGVSLSALGTPAKNSAT